MGIETAVLLMAASTALTVGGQIMQGQQQKKVANAQAQQALNDSAYQADAYKQQADQIRRAGKRQVGETNAALAASGVKLGEGTALELKHSIVQNSEQDALSAVLSGTRTQQAGAEQAALYRRAGKNAVTNSYIGAAKTVAGAAADYNRGGWK